MGYGRYGVTPGNTVELKCVFTDDLGNLVDPDDLPIVYLYDTNYSTEDIEAEHLAETYTGEGPYTPTRLSTGYYVYEAEISNGAPEGTWNDLWVASYGGIDSTNWLSFTVWTQANLASQLLKSNQVVVVELKNTIENTDGVALSETVQLHFTTRFVPYYASVDLLRLEVGPWIDAVPEDTLALMLHWSSLEADLITGSKDRHANYNLARTKFVLFDAAVRIANLPGIFSENVGGGSKRLADLQITKPSTTQQVGVASSGVDLETIKYFKEKREEWWRVVNAGGTIMPGQSLDPSFGVKGEADPDRRLGGRLWEKEYETTYYQPAGNKKVIPYGHRHGRFTWREPTYLKRY